MNNGIKDITNHLINMYENYKKCIQNLNLHSKLHLFINKINKLTKKDGIEYKFNYLHNIHFNKGINYYLIIYANYYRNLCNNYKNISMLNL